MLFMQQTRSILKKPFSSAVNECSVGAMVLCSNWTIVHADVPCVSWLTMSMHAPLTASSSTAMIGLGLAGHLSFSNLQSDLQFITAESSGTRALLLLQVSANPGSVMQCMNITQEQ